MCVLLLDLDFCALTTVIYILWGALERAMTSLLAHISFAVWSHVDLKVTILHLISI